MCVVLLVACQPASPTAIDQDHIEVKSITSNDTLTGQIIQTKTFNRCNAAGAFAAEVKFGETSSETTQKELIFSVGAGAEADIPTGPKAKIEAALEQHFATIKQNMNSHEEKVIIEVPAHTRQEYTIIWRETRREGTVEYTVNSQLQKVNYSYRVGLEFVSAEGNDIECPLPTVTSFPTNSPATTSPTEEAPSPPSNTPEPKTIADGCISSQTWTPDASDSSALSGIYTSIKSNSVIEFSIYVTSISMKFDNVAEVIFAVTPAGARLPARPTTRFKLHLEDAGTKEIIHYMMADSGEYDGVKLGTQHYEYGNTYDIRLELSGNEMIVFIDDYQMKEHLKLPTGAKVLYIGYSLPVHSQLNVNIGNIRVDGIAK
jgi:hypothetical protein